MTDKQKWLYFKEWAAVRRVDAQADRHELHIKALGRDKSSKELTNSEFDKVLGVFRAISQPASVDQQLRQLRQVKTRLIWKITEEQAALLSAVLPCVPGANHWDRRSAAEYYVLRVCRERFGGAGSVADLSAEPGPIKDGQPGDSQLEMLRNTLDRCINDLRGKAGLTIHEMRQLAGVACLKGCRTCHPVVKKGVRTEANAVNEGVAA